MFLVAVDFQALRGSEHNLQRPWPGHEGRGASVGPHGPKWSLCTLGAFGGRLARLSRSSVTAGSAPCSALLSVLWLSPSARNWICPGQSSWAHLGVVRGMRMPISSRATRRVTLPTREADLQNISK